MSDGESEGYDMMETASEVGESMESQYIPKQFDIDKLVTLPKEEREVLLSLMTSSNNMFREETQTTLQSYGLIIDRREGTINQLLNENHSH